jgi:hypothetical protein
MPHRSLARICYAAVALSLALPIHAQVNDPSTIARIREEGLQRSQVMDTLSYLTDVIGPRLTGSPQLKRANEWTRDKMYSWGLQNATLHAWGPFGRGWTLEKFTAQVTSPSCIPLIAYPKAWSPSTKGLVNGDVVLFDATTEEDLAKFKGKLKNAIVLTGAVRNVPAHFTPQGSRYTEEELQRMEGTGVGQGVGVQRVQPGTQRGAPGAPGAGAGGGRRGGGAPGAPGTPGAAPNPQFEAFMAQQRFAGRRMQFLMDEGAAIVLDSARGDGGTLFVQSATVPPPPTPATPAVQPGATGQPGAAGTPTATPQPRPGAGRGGVRTGPWSKDVPKILPQASLAVEHFNRLVRMVKAGEKVKAQIEIKAQFHDKDLMAYNTLAEIPGGDLKDEVVMVGAHIDSWHSGTGATDNGAGCAVAMEAVRIIQALGLKPRRTIRVGLWSGEEEGLMGSRAYVTDTFGSNPRFGQEGDPVRKPAYEKISGYFNLDNGTGKIRGVYCERNDAVMPIFKEWLKPFNDLGATIVTRSATGGTDHQSFDGIGIPGFQFVQDEIEYDARTHHSNMDVFDRIQADDMKQAATVMAAFLYNTAMRDEKLPRKTPAAPVR